ncbi:MAG: serine/threonine protein kinase [Planctomycetes bacterium]|nr:serine/threonine protein kinase [Planctomycetota bacterium]
MPETPTPETDRDEAFLRELLLRGWITGDQAAEVRRLKAAADDLHQDVSLDEILVKKSFLAPDRVAVARRDVAARIGQALRIGKYEILQRLGEGGAGIVYRAYQTALGREVALKVLSRRREGEEEYLERFLREAKVAVTLNHVNIVRGLDFGYADGYHYFAMELVEGESLLALVKREGRLTERKAIDVALQMVRALEHAQKFQIVHRDIKPENILMTRSGTAKLADLGLARPTLEGAGAADGAGRPMGTALYVAPEAIRREGTIDYRADIYSLGATLFQMLTGRPPYSGQTVQEIVRAHLSAPIPNPREFAMDLSTGAAAVVGKMLAKDPGERYQTLEQLDEDLASVLEGRPPVNTIMLGRRSVATAPFIDGPLEPGAKRPSPAPSSPARRRAATAAVVVLSLGVVGAGAFVVLRKKPEPPPPPHPVAVGPVDPGAGKGTDAESLRAAREEGAKKALAEAEEAGKAKGEDHPESVALLLEVAANHGGTVAGRVAASRAETLAKARADRAAAGLAARAEASAKALAESRLADALAAWSDLREEEREAGGAAEAEAAAARVTEALEARLAAAGALVEKVLGGDEASAPAAREALEALGRLGMTRGADAAAEGLAKVEEHLAARAAARAAAEAAWPGLCADVLAAAAKDPKQASSLLSGAEAALAPLPGRAELLRSALGDLSAFGDAVRSGFAKAASAGENLRLRVPGRPGGVVAGKAAGVRPGGFEIQRGPAVDFVAASEVDAGDLASLAWRVLGAGGPRDHAGAAAFFLSRGAQGMAAVEVKALEVLGDGPELRRTRALVEAALAAGRARAEAALREADLLRLQNRAPEARAALERAVASCEGWARPLWRLGALLLEGGKEQAEALRLLEAAAAAGPEEPEAWFHLAEARRRAGRTEEALAALERFMADAPAGDPRRGDAGRTLESLRAAAAKESLQQAREEAARAFRKDDFAGAEPLWRRVLAYDPADTEAMYFLGKCLVGLDRKVEAYSWLRRFLNADRRGGSRVDDARKVVRDWEQRLGDSPAAARKSAEGSNLVNQNDWKAGIEAFDAALDLAPLRAETWAERGRGLFTGWVAESRRDLLIEAAANLETALLLNERLGRGWSLLAVVSFHLDDMARSAEAGAKGMQFDPAYGATYEYRARACNRLERFAEGEQAAAEGIRKAPTAMMFIARAEARCGLGNLAGAREDLEVAARDYELTATEKTLRVEVLGRVIKAETAAGKGPGRDGE